VANLVQLKNLEEASGLLLVDKPQGIAFSTVVKTVKRKFSLVKVGHGGSLDAMASGLLVLLIGDANKFTGEIMGVNRSYEGTMLLGRKTDTYDIHGRDIGGDGTLLPNEEKITSIIKEFKGDIFQTESRFCSVRKECSPSYEVADTGEHKPFMVHVFRFAPSLMSEADKVSFSVTATKGLIPRSLVNDFGDMLGCGAVLQSLRRTSVGKFKVEESVTFEKLLEAELSDFPKMLLPISRIFS
jgi:tRNA pseudouridine55 synthase